MQILIDTNILLWIIFDDKKLSKNEIKYIYDYNNEIIVSSISIFEISLKYSLHKINLKGITPDSIPSLLKANGYIIENYDTELFSSFYKLPSNIHKDPFDRLLIWQAINKNYFLMSHDRKFNDYKKFGLKTL